MEKSEYQNELFEEYAGPAEKRPGRFEKSAPVAGHSKIFLSVSYEQLAFAAIILITMMVLVFSLGVERGKNFATPKTATTPTPPAAARQDSVKPVEQAAVSSVPPPAEPPPAAVAQKAEEGAAEAPKEASRPYTIQVATYWSKSNAKEDMENLRKKGLNSFIISTNGKYEVCVGEYIGGDDAKGDLKELKKKYKDCFLRRR